MKRTIKLALSASLLLGATSAFATNGDVMIGQGAKSRSMGGIGIAKTFGAESALANPAGIASVEGMEVTGALTMFTPSVSFGSNTGANATPATSPGGAYNTANASAPITKGDSAVGSSYIPEISFAHRLTDNFVYGVSVNGVAGMGTDYKDTAATGNGAFDMTTALSILKVSVPLAYSNSGFTLGVSPVFQYGTLQMNYLKSDGAGGYVRSTNPESSDSAFGFEVGIAYDMFPAGETGLTIAAVYKSKIEMEYANNIGAAMKDFGVQSIKSGDKLDQPAEFGIGFAYEVSGSTLAFDYKNIAWADAAGYGDFGWENQNVYAFGYEYAASSWALRLGYNYGKSPISEQANTMGDPSGYDAGAKNFFNLSGFPGIVKQHYTFGGGYSISKAFSLDAAVVYAPEVTESFNTSGMSAGMVYQGQLATNGGDKAAAAGAAGGTGASSADVTHSQMGFTIAATYSF